VRTRRAAIACALFASVFVLAACSGDDGGSDGEAEDPSALEGEDWVLTQMLTAGGQTEIVDVGVSASFDGSTISGVSGCNRYDASYEASGGEISFGPIGGTMMACPEPQGSTEARFLQLLEGVASFEVSGRSMSMNDADGTPVLQFMQG
jgi:heat shock protein HslJ